MLRVYFGKCSRSLCHRPVKMREIREKESRAKGKCGIAKKWAGAIEVICRINLLLVALYPGHHSIHPS